MCPNLAPQSLQPRLPHMTSLKALSRLVARGASASDPGPRRSRRRSCSYIVWGFRVWGLGLSRISGARRLRFKAIGLRFRESTSLRCSRFCAVGNFSGLGALLIGTGFWGILRFYIYKVRYGYCPSFRFVVFSTADSPLRPYHNVWKASLRLMPTTHPRLLPQLYNHRMPWTPKPA